jgi:uncharacterized membrane protein
LHGRAEQERLVPRAFAARRGGNLPEVRRFRLAARWDALRRSFWFLPALAMAGGAGLAWVIGSLDDAIDLHFGVVSFNDPSSARRLLQTIATVTVTVIGISFSVTVVALQLASQQLGPRVLRTFQADALNKFVLSLFLGLFVYCLVVLTLDTSGSNAVPELAVAVALALAIVAFGAFVAFIHNIVESLQASTLIKRIAADGQRTLEHRFPESIGSDPPEPAAAENRVSRWTGDAPPLPVPAPRAGFLVGIDERRLMEAAIGDDVLVVQRVAIGDFAVTGAVLADIRGGRGDRDDVAGQVAEAFRLEGERTVVQDVAFPLRQLADVALRALSPGLNDPTTAENAMGSATDMLVRFARRGAPSPIRVDGQGTPRFIAIVPGLDDLVRLGFDQVRVAAATHPLVAARLIELLRHVEEVASAYGRSAGEARRQRRLLGAGVEDQVPTAEDELFVSSR